MTDLIVLVLFTQHLHLLPQCTHLVLVLHWLVLNLPSLCCVPATMTLVSNKRVKGNSCRSYNDRWQATTTVLNQHMDTQSTRQI